MRDPSIHITKHQFEKILSQLEVYNFPIDAFFVIARKEAINTRVVVVTNNKTTKKVSNILLASKGDAALVADIIYATRIKLKHRGVRKIRETEPRNWAKMIREYLIGASLVVSPSRVDIIQMKDKRLEIINQKLDEIEVITFEFSEHNAITPLCLVRYLVNRIIYKE